MSKMHERFHSPVFQKAIAYSDAKKSADVWLEFEGKTSDGQTIKLCDYASTGKEYAKPQDPADWEGMIKNEVETTSKVWLKTKK